MKGFLMKLNHVSTFSGEGQTEIIIFRTALFEGRGTTLLIFSYLFTFFFSPESNAAAFRFLRGHEFTNSLKNNFKLGVIFLFKGFQFTCQFGIRCKHFAESNKSPYNLDTSMYS